jgi:hypothetical protein
MPFLRGAFQETLPDQTAHPSSTAAGGDKPGQGHAAGTAAALQVAALRVIAALLRTSAAAAAAAARSWRTKSWSAANPTDAGGGPPDGNSHPEVGTAATVLSHRLQLRSPDGSALPLPPQLLGPAPRQQHQDLQFVRYKSASLSQKWLGRKAMYSA